jgi:hypothetical protein
MRFRKVIIVVSVFLLLLTVSACARTGAGSASIPQVDFEYTSLEQLSPQSDIIVIGIIDRIEQADDFNQFYHLKITDIVRGTEKRELIIYGNSKLIESGKEYCLFLYENDSEFWPMPLTLLVDCDSVFEIAGTDVLAPERYNLSEAKNTFMQSLSTLPAPSNRKVISVKEKLSNAELLSQSDYIFTAKVDELVYTSPYAGGSAMLSVVKMFKGDGGMDQNKELMNLLVPQGLEVGKTYLFFRNKGLEGMPSRLNSIIDIEAPEYTAIYELLS